MRNLLFLLFALVCFTANANTPIVYKLELDDEVDATMWRHTKRALQEARDKNADMLFVRINTYGGAVDSADSIRTALLRMPIPVIAFVDNNAASAGALITLACDTVYMTPDASMGASTVVNGTGEPMPDKYQAYMKSIMRATAESHGKYLDADSTWRWRRDPVIAEGMVNPDSVISLTAREAVACGYAEGIANNADEVLSKYAGKNYDTQSFEPSISDNILGFLASAGVRAILIMLILGGIYMEMHSPGLGFAGAVAFTATVLYFLPSFVTGTIAAWVIIAFISGIVLLALEIFVIPGFGFAGVGGIVAIFAALLGGMLNPDALSGGYTSNLVEALCVSAIGLILAIAVVWYLTSKHGPKCVRRISELQTTQKISEGYIGVDAEIGNYVGKEGIAVTDLRPAGKIRIGEDDFDAVSLNGFIEAGRVVKVEKFENAQLYVKSKE